MGFKHSKCLKEKLGQELAKSVTISSRPKKMSTSSKALKKTNPVPRPPPDRENHHKMDTLDRKHDKLNCSTYPELFENEDQSDVTFLVGVDSWRFPGHKDVLAPASPVFSAMLKGPLSSTATKEEIPIEDVEPRAFENILRFIYIGDVKLLNIQSTFYTLYATDKYMLPELTRLCLEALEFSLSVNNVLFIHHGIRLFCSVWLSSNEGMDSGSSSPQHCTTLLHTLQNRCLELIDTYAEQVLICEDFDNLSPDEVSEIAFRDTLQVNNEISVFEALHRWTIQQCKRNQKAMTWKNKQDCLTSTLYAVRYLLMTKDEFLAGPGSTELLTSAERDWLLAKITGRNDVPPPTNLANRIKYFERRRGYHQTAVSGGDDEGKEVRQEGHLNNLMTTEPFVDPWCDKGKSKNKKQCCCKASKVITECFVCFSLFFD